MQPSTPTVHRIALAERRHPPDRPRRPEGMAMNAAESVEQFHAGGATVSGMDAAYELSAHSLDALVPPGGRLLDLGVGSGRGLCRFLALRPDVSAVGVDIAPNMLAEARRLIGEGGLDDRVELLEADIGALPAEVSAQAWDAVASVWTLHHMPDRARLRGALAQIVALRDRDGCAVWLLDLQRLRDPESFPAFVAALQPELPPVLRSDALASEAAAFTHEELRSECDAAGLAGLESGVAQPVAWLQAFWRHGRGASEEERRASRPIPRDAPLLRGGFSRLPIETAAAVPPSG